MSTPPPLDKSLAGLLRDLLDRLGLVERRLNRPPSAVASGTTDPTSAPNQLGAIYIRTDTGKVYVAVGITSASDWALVN